MWRRCRPSWKPTRATPPSGQRTPSTTSTGECALALPAEDLGRGPQNPAVRPLRARGVGGLRGWVGGLLQESAGTSIARRPTLPAPRGLCRTPVLRLIPGPRSSPSELCPEGGSCGARPLGGPTPHRYSFLFSPHASTARLPSLHSSCREQCPQALPGLLPRGTYWQD